MSKNGSVETPPFVVPLVGATVDLQPLGPEAIDAKVQAAFTDPRLFELASGLGEAPAADYLQHVLFETHDLTLWSLTAADGAAPLGLAVYSRYTTLDRVAVYFWDRLYRDLDLWNEAIALLVEHVFAHVPQAGHVYVHLPLPVPEDFHNALMLQGFAPWNTRSLLRSPERAAYGLDRAVFDLYRQEVDVDEGDDEGDDDDGPLSY